jgi:hypothetical protein
MNQPKGKNRKEEGRMEKTRFATFFWTAVILVGLLAFPTLGSAREAIQEWELINPAGTIAITPVKPAPRLSTLEGKTVVLRWNGKHNGNNFLDRVAELLAEKVPGAKVVKLYEVDKSTVKISGSNAESARIAKVIKELKGDLVIGSQAD